MAEQSSTRQRLPAGALSSRGLVLAAAMMAIVLTATEGSIVATAMPTIVAHLGGFPLFSWAFAAFLLTQAVSIPIYGRLADLYGRKPVFFAGTSLFLYFGTPIPRDISGLASEDPEQLARTVPQRSCNDTLTIVSSIGHD